MNEDEKSSSYVVALLSGIKNSLTLGLLITH